jgi:hypothetical protein
LTRRRLCLAFFLGFLEAGSRSAAVAVAALCTTWCCVDQETSLVESFPEERWGSKASETQQRVNWGLEATSAAYLRAMWVAAKQTRRPEFKYKCRLQG